MGSSITPALHFCSLSSPKKGVLSDEANQGGRKAALEGIVPESLALRCRSVKVEVWKSMLMTLSCGLKDWMR